jgi:proteasome lid subunit RPN8/RPN11
VDDRISDETVKGILMRLSAAIWAEMTTQLDGCLPEEGCGLVGGLGEVAQLVFPVTNLLHSPVRFRMDAAEQLKSFLQLEAIGLDLIAIYHSHPAGPEFPSRTDLDEFSYPESAAIIVSPGEYRWKARAFWMRKESFEEIELIIE